MHKRLEVQREEIPSEQMTTGLVQLNAAGEIIMCNAQMSAFFPGIVHIGKALADVLNEAEKSGFIAAGDAGPIQHNADRYLMRMKDGRAVLQTTQAYESGNQLLEFHDVSHVVTMTLTQQRDVLTGLANRLELSRQLLAAFAHKANCFALLYIDLDRFKLVNDTVGHPIGDALLKLVADRMSRLLAPGDVLARLGGDEFAILLPINSLPTQAEALALRLIDVISRPYLIQGHSLQVGASVGIALAPIDGKTPEELIKNADLALFKAKSQGRGSLRFFTEDLGLELQARREMEIGLRRALVMEEFAVVYQPQFQIAGNSLVGFEALVRWSTPERGSVSPAQFIPLAEEIGLIGRLGEWVLRTACLEAASWPAELSVSVNLSPRQFPGRWPRQHGRIRLDPRGPSGVTPGAGNHRRGIVG